MIMCPNLSTNHDGTIATWMKPHQQGGQVKLECIYLSPFTDYNIVWFHWWGWGGMLMNLKHIFRTRAWEMASCKGPFWPWLSFRQNTKTDEQKKTPATTKNSFVPGMPRPLDVHGRWEYPEAMNFPAPKQCANDFKKSEMRKLQRATLSFFFLVFASGQESNLKHNSCIIILRQV